MAAHRPPGKAVLFPVFRWSQGPELVGENADPR